MATRIGKRLMLLVIFALHGTMDIGLFAQTVPENQYAPTPKALEMTRYGHMPPDLNSGVYSYDIPIYTYEDKYFRIPVSLHYSSSGFQPARMSDEAGLHWTLMAGGAITREIVGVDDFADGGLYGYGNQVSDSLLYNLIKPAGSTDPVLCYAGNNTPSLFGYSKECSSDRYHFTFPGHSGSFVMNHAGDDFIVYGTEEGKGLYEVSWDGPSNSFTIQTGDGYSYRFGHCETNSSEKAKERTWSREAVGGGETASALVLANTHIVTWLLDKITASNGSTIEFQYVSSRSNQDIPQTNDDVITAFSRHPYRRPPDNGTQYYKEASLTYTSYLSRIIVDKPLNTGDTLKIDFQWTRDSGREISGSENNAYKQLIVPRRHLSSVTVKKGSTTLRQASLTYTSDGCRPLLTNVELSGIGNYSMTYWTSSSSPLPGILCNGLDFWGYYNGQDNLNDSFFNPMGVDEDLNEYISGNGMDPSWQHAQLGLLKTITYPAGGTTTIAYEPNKAEKIVLRRKAVSGGLEPANPYLDPGAIDYYLPSLFPISIISSSFATDSGGVRVKTLTDDDNISSSIYSYTYSGGIVQQFPRFYSGSIGNTPLYNPALRFPGSSFDQRHIAYKTVTEHYPDSARVVTTFSSWENQPDEYSSHWQWLTSPVFPNDSTMQCFVDNILREPDSRTYRRGMPIKRKTYSTDGTQVREETWDYSDIGSAYNTYAVISGQYAWTARTFLCDRKPSSYECKDWLDESNVSITDETTYAYNGRGQLKKTTGTSGGHTEIQMVTYPCDISSGVYTSMVADGYHNYPVERVTVLDGKVTGANLTTYYHHPGSGMYLPRNEYHAHVGEEGIAYSSFTPFNGASVNSVYENDLHYDNYYNNGNLKESTGHDGVHSMYIWDSRGDKLSAVFVGATEGTRTYYVRGAVPYTETDTYAAVTEAEKTFEAEEPGSFSLTFTPANTSDTITAKLDGNTLTIQSLGGGVQGTASPVTVTAGTHTVLVTRTNPQLNLSGELSITYPRTGAVAQGGIGSDCMFQDFESEGGSTGYGFQSAKGRTSNCSLNIGLVVNRPFVLDYMRRDGTTWNYVREAFIPTESPTVLNIEASTTNPVDHIRVYPADCSVRSYTWWPTGELRCEVDASGRFLTYEYDALGRLTTVRDSDGAIVKQYTYHYMH